MLQPQQVFDIFVTDWQSVEVFKGQTTIIFNNLQAAMSLIDAHYYPHALTPYALHNLSRHGSDKTDINDGSCEGSETGSKWSSEEGSEEGSEQGSEEGSEQGSEQGYEQGNEEGGEEGSEEGSEEGNDVVDALWRSAIATESWHLMSTSACPVAL